ncbi:hypothetical protein [Streptomyces sp. HB2AG]|uniref:hypothetical protein n=1 Tax=Streptomyces sp. HB2AG TaxID=2983400 RepID=UPI0022AAB470|nr:hypothetical protein [Streptomyces sp. HB2AG]MCZ2525747.1 hypothetical protein [Streptomyces sp. HB2AG]
MDLGNFEPANKKHRNRLQYRLALNLVGASFMLVVFLVLAALRGNFSLLWTLVTLCFTTGAFLSALGWKKKKPWLAFLGSSALLSLVLVGIVNSRH